MRTHDKDDKQEGEEISAAEIQEMMLEMTTDLMWAVDEKYRLVWKNKAFDLLTSKNYGLRLSVGENIMHQKIPVLNQKKWKNYYDRVLQTHEEFNIELETSASEHNAIIEFCFRPIVTKSEKISGVAVTGRDITRYRLVEKSLRASEIKFRAIVEQSHQAMFLHDMQGNLVDVNKAASVLTGYSHEELLQMSVFDIDPDASKRLDKKNIWNTLRHLSEKTIEVRHRKKDGSFYPAEVTLGKIEFENHSYVLSLARDISNRIKNEQEIKKERDTAKLYLDLAGFIFLRIDRFGCISMANKKCCELLDYTEEELIGKNWFDNFLPQENREKVKAIFDMMSKGEKLFAEFYENTILTRNHQERLISWHNVILYNEDGSFAGTLSSGEDITDKRIIEEKIRKSEEDFRNLFENATIGIYRTTPDGRIIMANPALVRMLGFTDTEQLFQRNLELHGFAPENPREIFLHELKKTGEVNGLESVWIKKNGDKIIVNEKARTVKDNEGNILYLEGMVDDITLKKTIENELKSNLTLLRIAGETAKFGGWMVNVDEDKVIWSEVVAAIHEMPAGYSPTIEEAIGFSAPEWQQRIRSLFNYCVADGIPFNEEIEIITAKKKRVWVKVNGEAVRDENGRVTKVHGSFQNIDDFKKAQSALRLNEQKFESSLEVLMDAFGIYTAVRNDEGKIVDFTIGYVNDMACQLNNLSKQEQIGKSLLETLPSYKSNGLFEEYTKVVENDKKLLIESFWYEDVYGNKRLKRAFDIKASKFGDGFVASWSDVTQRILNHEALEKSQAQTRALIEAIPDLVFKMDKNGVYLDYKAAKGELYYQKEEIIGKNNRDITPSDFADMVEEKTKSALKTGEIQQFEYQLTIPGKGQQDYEARMVPVNNEEVLTLVRNITERKDFERQLAESEANARTIMESTNDLLFLLDKDGIVIDSNEAHAKRFGLTRAALIGKNIFDLLPPSTAQNRRDMVQKVLKTGKPVKGEDFREKYWNELHIYPIFLNNKLTEKVAVYVRDITLKKQTDQLIIENEAKYRTLFENLSQGIFYQDADGKIVDANQAALKILGLTRNQLLGKDSYDKRWKLINEKYEILPPEEHPSIVALRSGKSQLNQTIGIFIPETDTYNWLIIDAIPQFHPGEEHPYQVFTAMQDITFRKLTEETLQKNEKHLRELNASKDKFFSIIAHDLRSPFSAIIGFSELMVEQIRQKDYDGIDEMAEVILRSSNHALDLLTNLLEWSRSQTGRIIFEPSYIELVSLIKENIELLRPAASQKSISIAHSLPTIATVYADKGMINTILRNLISNAVKFTSKNGEINVSLTENDQMVKVIVQDTGIGISRDNLKKLFHIDSNFSTPGTNHEQGTGLGLILCREFVEKHGGKIWVESSLGKGSKFFFTLPKSF